MTITILRKASDQKIPRPHIRVASTDRLNIFMQYTTGAEWVRNGHLSNIDTDRAILKFKGAIYYAFTE